MEHREFVERLFDRELALVSQWIGMDPKYTENTFDFSDEFFCHRPATPEGFVYQDLYAPSSFSQLELEEVTASTRSMADRFVRRQVLRRDDFEIDGIGRVAAFVSSNPDVTNPEHHPWVGERFIVGRAKPGLRVLRMDLPCLACMATGGSGDVGCGDEFNGATCDRGWLSRGGVVLQLATSVATERVIRPKDARWHAWFDG